MPKISYFPDDVSIEVDEGEILLNASKLADIPHMHLCGGAARCSTCRVLVLDGLANCSEPSRAEQAVRQQLCFQRSMRLACQMQVLGDVTVRRLVVDPDDAEAATQQMKHRDPIMPAEEKHLAILFADIRDFTPLAEQLLPYDVMYLLNRYFQALGRVVQAHGGMINNYMGDGFMALFGIHEGDRHVADHAIVAAVEMLEAMEKLNEHIAMLYHRRLEIGIGLHYGSVVVGNVGVAEDQRITAIGDAVNFAARIESANKVLGSHLLISDAMYNHVRDRVQVGRQTRLELKGKQGEYCLHEVLGLTNASIPDARDARSPHSSRSLWQRIKRIWHRFTTWLHKL